MLDSVRVASKYQAELLPYVVMFTGSRLVVPIRYMPLARPCAPTIMRQLAYLQNAPVVGPEDDPDGWKTLEPIAVEGTVFKTLKTSASCRVWFFSDANPARWLMILTRSSPYRDL